MKNEKIKSIIVIFIAILVLFGLCKILGNESKRAYNNCINNGYSETSCLEAYN